MQRTPRFSKQYWLRLAQFTALTSILGALFTLGYLITLQVDAFARPTRRDNIGSPEAIKRPHRDVTLITRDGLQISGWYVAGARAEAVILVHGIDNNRREMIGTAAMLGEAGYHTLLLDLRGHGRSQGEYVTYGLREALDIQAGIDYLLAQPDVERVGAIGNSLGGSAVVRAAALDARLDAIVIQASFSSLELAVADAFDDMSVLPKWPFAPLLVWLVEREVGMTVGQVDSARDLATMPARPVLIIHGQRDGLFPPHHAQRMFEAAKEPKSLWLIEDMGHGNPADWHEAAYRQRVLTFFAEAFAP